MLIFGIGTDIVEVRRMERAISSNWSETFIHRVFTQHEIEICLKSAHPAQAFAARFAGKEAVVKALGTGFSRGISAKLIEITGGERSRPRVCLAGGARLFAMEHQIAVVHVSLTHTPTYAGAFAVAEMLST